MNLLAVNLTAQQAMQLTTLIAPFASLLTSAELVAVRGELQAGGLADSRILSRGSPIFSHSAFRTSWLTPIALLQVLASVSVLLTWSLPEIHRVLVGIFPIGLVLQKLLLTYGGDGSDDMALLVSLPIGFVQLFADQVEAQVYALGFIAAQLVLCYFASGIAKFTGRSWRSGAAISEVMHTASWGFNSVAALLDRHPRCTRIATWGVVTFETLFPVGIVIGGKIGLATLVTAACFHVLVAALMGLNRFTLWFLAAYPATLFAMNSWREWVGIAGGVNGP